MSIKDLQTAPGTVDILVVADENMLLALVLVLFAFVQCDGGDM
jgi:hypothetical protein